MEQETEEALRKASLGLVLMKVNASDDQGNTSI